MFWLIEDGSDEKLMLLLLLLLDFCRGVALQEPAEGPTGVLMFSESLSAPESLAAPSVPPPPPAYPDPDVPVLVAAVWLPSAVGMAMFSVNSSSSISKDSSLSGTLTALALLYSFSWSILTTRVLLFLSCLAQEGLCAIWSSVSLLVGSVHTVHV